MQEKSYISIEKDKKVSKNLVNSKICCNFARFFRKARVISLWRLH